MNEVRRPVIWRSTMPNYQRLTLAHLPLPLVFVKARFAEDERETFDSPPQEVLLLRQRYSGIFGERKLYA